MAKTNELSLAQQAGQLKEAAKSADELATYMKFNDRYSLGEVAQQCKVAEEKYNDWQLFVKRHKLA